MNAMFQQTEVSPELKEVNSTLSDMDRMIVYNEISGQLLENVLS